MFRISLSLNHRFKIATSILLLLTILISSLTLPIGIRQAGAVPVQVSVTVTQVIELISPDESLLGGGPGDYYVAVTIGNVYQESVVIEAPNIFDTPYVIEPFWTISATSDTSLSTIPVRIELLDEDGGFNPNDHVDINPAAGKSALDLTYTFATNSWSGDIPTNTGSSGGPSDSSHDDDGSARIAFGISIGDGDFDDDGIPDGIELFGIFDNNGILIQNTNGFGFPMDPCRKTVAVEIDFLNVPGVGGHSHQPQAQSINRAVAAFNNAAVVPAAANCPYVGFPTQATGLNLVVDVDSAVFEINQFLTIPNTPGTQNLDTIKAGNFNDARRPYFHYNVWGHDQPNCPPPAPPNPPTTCPNPTPFVRSGSSGLAEGGPDASGVLRAGNDFIVTLNGFTAGLVNGATEDQLGTFMHELGHNLGLGHGGNQIEPFNCKPNYLSVMNYEFQVIGIPDPNLGPPPAGSTLPFQGRFDYSSQVLPSLNEGALSENAGISDATDFTYWTDLTATLQTGQGNGPLDWDWDTPNFIDDAPGLPNPQNVAVDINNDQIVNCGLNAALNPAPSPGQTLPGFNDWNSLDYIFRDDADYLDGMHSTISPVQELTDRDAQKIRDSASDLFSPDLRVTKQVDKSDAIPGDTLAYTVEVTNIGTGTSKDNSLIDTAPDSDPITSTLPDFNAGDSVSRTYTYTIPFPVVDGTILSNTAEAFGNNLLGYSLEDSTNNKATAFTTVHTPVLQITKLSDSQVQPGGAINYRIFFENSGSGDAERVILKDTLPPGMYYSLPLDQGTGPKPDSVSINLDGTTSLTWIIGALPASSGISEIHYTARASLLYFNEEGVTNTVMIDFTDQNANDYPFLVANSTTIVRSLPLTEKPMSHGYWKTHQNEWTFEVLGRIHGTDQRFDGSDGTTADGLLSASEISAVFSLGGNEDGLLKRLLLSAYFNLATGKVNADTVMSSRLATLLNIDNVREAIDFGQNTLSMPFDNTTKAQYHVAVLILLQIMNKI